MRLIGKNGKPLKVGSKVEYDGCKCRIFEIDAEHETIGLEAFEDGVLFDCWNVDPETDLGARWNEEDYVKHFFDVNRRLDNLPI